MDMVQLKEQDTRSITLSGNNVFVPSFVGRLWSGQRPVLSFAHPYFLPVFVGVQMNPQRDEGEKPPCQS